MDDAQLSSILSFLDCINLISEKLMSQRSVLPYAKQKIILIEFEANINPRNESLVKILKFRKTMH